ncbi:MAG: TonB-dependent receptor [Bacteroidota bacterium]
MKQTSILILILLLLINVQIFSQPRSGGNRQPRLGIVGHVLDKKTNDPLEYVNIVVLKEEDNTQVNGGITDTEGKFRIIGIRPGKYIAKVSYIGFKSVFVDDIDLNRSNRVMDLGNIYIEPASLQLEDAKVVGEKTPIEYKIDKKVINVSEQSTSISGSAVDVLENVPSVRVDIEGNVALRGSGSFTLLIDGRPSVLDATDALEQIPATSIDKIEIITNPSAKYDPEGVSGIINIISKKHELDGISAIINGNAGMHNTFGGDFTSSYRTKEFSLNLGARYNERYSPGSSLENRRTFNDTASSFLNSNGISERARTGWSINGGGDYKFSENDIIGFSARYGDRSGGRNSEIDYFNYTEPITTEKRYTSSNQRERSGDFFSSNLNYTHTFGPKQHNIYLEAMYQKRNGDEFTINEYIESDGTISDGRKNTEVGPGIRRRLKLDYSYPLSEDSKLEAGLKYEMNNSEDDTKSYIFDPANSDYEYEDEYSYIIDYTRNISAAYGIYSGSIWDIGLQGGLRGEYTYRLIELVDSNSSTLIDRLDYFPTFHATYKLNEIQQIMASYTSRIRRPRGWYLEPFDVWTDANNIRRGNPNLQPEYIDSYELAFLTNWGNSLVSLEAYYRIRKNKIERVREVYAKDITLMTYTNFGRDYSFGTEMMLNTDLLKFWNMNLMGDLYHYKIVGTFKDEDLTKENFNWSVRLNNTFKIFESTKVQINGSYNSPSISAQNEMKSSISANFAIKQEFFNKKLSLTLQVRDLFNSAIHEGNSYGPGFESYYTFERDAPYVSLNVSLNLNNFKKERKKGGTNGNGDMDDDEF